MVVLLQSTCALSVSGKWFILLALRILPNLCDAALTGVRNAAIPGGNVSFFFGQVEGITQRDLAPSLQRQARSFGSGEYGIGILPLLLAIQQAKSQADPAAADPAAADPAAQPKVSSLSALLPFLLGNGLNGRLGGGSSFGGSYEGPPGGGLNSLIPLLAIAAAATPAPTPAQGSGAMMAGAGTFKAAELQLMDEKVPEKQRNLKRYPSNGAAPAPTAHHSAAPVAAFPTARPATSPADDCAVRQPRSSVCDDLPVDKILALKNSIVVVKGRKLYRVRPNGDPFDMHPTMLDEKMEMMTATATIGQSQYVFQGDKVTKYDMQFKAPVKGKYPKPVTEEFPGVLTPVDGVFQLNNHTYVFASGAKFVYYQPNGNPKVDPRYSPQYLDDVPGVPPTIDSAFTIKDRKFVHKQGSIYELAPNEMKAIGEIPVASSVVDGWLKCPELFPPSCGKRQVDTLKKTSTKPTTTTPEPEPSMPLP